MLQQALDSERAGEGFDNLSEEFLRKPLQQHDERRAASNRHGDWWTGLITMIRSKVNYCRKKRVCDEQKIR